MNVNLPSVINSVIQLAEHKEDESKNLEMREDKRIVICLSKSLSKDDKRLLQHYGRFVEYDHHIQNNVDLEKVDFDYLSLDLRKQEDRFYLQKHVLNHLEEVNLVLFRYQFEGDNGLSYTSEKTELPPKQISKKVFDQLLLTKNVDSPSCIISFLKALVCQS